MKSLQRVTSHFSDYAELQQFYDDLPAKPYCSDTKNFCKVSTKSHAVKHAYIQPNFPQLIKWLIIDIDSPLKHTAKKPYYDENLIFRFSDRHLPTPTFIARNRENGHVQYFIKLAKPVPMFSGSHEHPMRFLTNIQYALNVLYGGDMSFGGSLAKNPLDTTTWDIFITGAGSYTLNELAEFIDFSDPANKPPKKARNDEKISPFAGLGRNCDTFDYLRFLAYPIAYKMTQSALYKHLLKLGLEFNSRFKQPMLLSEVRAIARSIAKFCKTSPKYRAYTLKFSKKQAEKGRKGGLVSDSSFGGLARSQGYNEQRQRAKAMFDDGMKISAIATALNVHRNSVRKWVKEKCTSASLISL